jgi:hypothetical protein
VDIRPHSIHNTPKGKPSTTLAENHVVEGGFMVH